MSSTSLRAKVGTTAGGKPHKDRRNWSDQEDKVFPRIGIKAEQRGLGPCGKVLDIVTKR